MKERPIIFNDEMVRAIIEGRKTQTRRPVRPQPFLNGSGMLAWRSGCLKNFDRTAEQVLASHCPYGRIGDRLWVRECYGQVGSGDHVHYRATEPDYETRHATNWYDRGFRWTPSIHMPRWASRITLEIAAVRVERVQDTSRADARAEGGAPLGDAANAFLYGFARMWGKIYGLSDHKWAANPWVWVIEFRRVEK